MNIYEKLLEVQLKLKAPKSQFNKFGGYNYRNCEDILEAVKPLCEEVKAVLLLTDSIEVIGDRYYVKATAKFIDTEKENSVIENIAYAREAENKKGMDESQVTGATSSYARKYALNGLFNIDDTKDADSDEFQEQQNKAINKTPAKKVLSNGSSPEDAISETHVKAFKLWVQNHKIASDVLQNTIFEYGYKTIEEIKNKDYKTIVNKLDEMLKEEKINE